VGSFAGAILVGTALLRLPLAAGAGAVSLLEAFFTATSAVCVTGLTVVDTGTRFSPAGQAIILALIQAGGLGIMTYAVFVSLLLGRDVSFTDRRVIQDSLHHSPTPELVRLVRHVLVFTAGAEALGAALLGLSFGRHLPPGQAAWQGVFHAVSAFCNAGFSLQPDNLVRWRADVLVNAVVTGLILVGGLGFLVNMELREQVEASLRRRRRPPLSLHARLVLVVTAVLLGVGTLAFLGLEWGNLLKGLPPGERLLAAWFQAVTPRTAGFNTVDLSRATTATLFVTTLLMMIGASPGSTGGGVKTTTLGLITALFVARWRGRGRATVFKRTIPHAVMDRALSLALLAAVFVSLAVGLLLVTEGHSVPFEQTRPRFIALLFEAVSAFGTVGLSTGVTASLSSAGKLVLIVLMFVGRVGPLTLVLAVGPRLEKGRFRYAEENVMVG
jgi:trk system potassium uptake protein TrkH